MLRSSRQQVDHAQPSTPVQSQTLGNRFGNHLTTPREPHFASSRLRYQREKSSRISVRARPGLTSRLVTIFKASFEPLCPSHHFLLVGGSLRHKRDRWVLYEPLGNPASCIISKCEKQRPSQFSCCSSSWPQRLQLSPCRQPKRSPYPSLNLTKWFHMDPNHAISVNYEFPKAKARSTSL